MSSRANRYRSRKRRRSYGDANQEQRKKAFEIYRTVSRISSESVFAALTLELTGKPQGFEEYPPVSQYNIKHRATILDPRVMKDKFGRGFESGFNFSQSLHSIREQFGGVEQYDVEIEEVAVVGLRNRRRLIVAVIADERLRKEQAAIRKSLADAGVRGFRGKNSNAPDTTNIPLAILQGHLASDSELAKNMPSVPEEELPMSSEQLADAVEARFTTNGITVLQLGKLVTKTT